MRDCSKPVILAKRGLADGGVARAGGRPVPGRGVVPGVAFGPVLNVGPAFG